MKNFTRLFSFLIAAFVGVSVNAQTDLSVTGVDAPNDNGKVPLNFQTTVAYTITNSGQTAVSGTYDVIRTVSNNGIPVVGPSMFQADINLNIGESFTVPATAGGPYVFSEPHGNLENVCVTYYVPALMEADTLNNLFCRTFEIDSTLSDDVGVDSLEMIDPTRAQVHRFDIDADANTPPTIQELQFNFNNFADFAITNQEVTFEIALNTIETRTIALSIETFPADTFTTLVAQNLDMEIPKEEADYDLCVRLVNQNDDDPSNDEVCESFKILNTPFSVEENVEESINILIANDFIGVTNAINPDLDVQILDMNGRVVKAEQISNANIKIQTTDLPAGGYIINYVDRKTGKAHQQKFSKI